MTLATNPLSAPPAAALEYLAELRKLTSGDIRTDQVSRVLYSTDASIYQVLPHAVVLPRNTEELHAAVELAAKHQVPILPRTGGSSLSGQAVNAAVVLDLTPNAARLRLSRARKRMRMWLEQPQTVGDAAGAHRAS